MEKMLNIEKLKKSKKFVYFHDDSHKNITTEYVKNLRKKLKMSQSIFASLLGVTKKTIEKWEQGKNPVVGPAAKLLFLLEKKPEIVNEFYGFEVVNDIENIEDLEEDRESILEIQTDVYQFLVGAENEYKKLLKTTLFDSDLKEKKCAFDQWKFLVREAEQGKFHSLDSNIQFSKSDSKEAQQITATA